MRRHTLSLMILAALSGLAGAQGFRPSATAAVDSVPNGMNYQGRLEKDGFPVSGDKVMAFRLYDAVTGGNILYNSGNVTVTITQGIFGTSLDIPFTALTGTAQKYLEIDVDGITLAPRDPLRAVPYAKVAETVEGTIDVTNSGLTFTTPIGDALAISSVSGRVGIGTNSPVARLTVSSGTGETGNIFVVSTGAVTLASINGNGQVTANAYFGDGTTLTGVVKKPGDGMTGPLTLNGSSLTVHGAADFGSIGSKSGFSAAGVLTMASGANIVLSGVGRISGLPSPASTSEAATKQYVDTVVVSSTGWTATPGVVRLTTIGDSTGLGTNTPQTKLDVVGSAAFGSGATRSTFSAAGVLTLAAPLATAQGGTGNANGTVASLTNNGANCGAGNAPLGVDASGAVESCFDVGTQTELDAHTNATSAHSATSANTASRIVLRDASGNFSANNINANITGTITGNAATASELLNNGANCAAGTVPLGVDTFGAAESCLDVGTQTELDAHANATSVHSATNLNTASRIVLRDASGNFSAGTITANLTGNASGSAGSLANNGGNCGAGNAPLGVDTLGAVESCFDVGTQTELDAHINATSVHSATNLNTASRIVLRDASGNFSAGTITANLTGNASGSAGSLANNGGNCGAGNAPLGVDTLGAVESCFDVGTQTELDAHINATSVHSATNLNTASRLVLRDASGNFLAGQVTVAKLVGNATASAGVCGTLPVLTGTDVAGSIVVGTGNPASCIINFSAVYTSVPACVVTATDTALTYGATATTAALTITASADMSSKVLNYICIGH